MTGEGSVASEARLFVGQIPAGVREDALLSLFRVHGTVRNLHILKGFDSKPRGCAMVLYQRWSQAEAAAEALNGKTGQLLGQTRPLVVHFANPRRNPSGPPEPGIAPRKLFIGQVPRDVDEEVLRPLFQPYGKIEHISILRTQRGQSAGCAFVQYSKWAEAEDAIDAHNGKTRLPGADVPMVVKFADAKKRDSAAAQPRSPLDAWNPGLRRQAPDLAELAGAGAYNHALAGLGRQGASLGGPGYQDGGMHGLMGSGGQLQGAQQDFGGYSQHLSSSMLGEQQALLNQMDSLGLNNMPSQSGADYSRRPDFSRGGADFSMADGGPSSSGLPGGLQNPGYNDLFAMQAQLGHQLQQQRAAGQPGQMPLPSMYGGPSSLQGAVMGQNGRAFGQRISSHDRHNEWKLFVGQVPLEATERDLEEIFAPLGDIVELYVLRNNNGKSRGCAFVTFADKAQAQQAITQLNGRQVPPNKALVVKFADRAQSAKAPLPGSPPLPLGAPPMGSPTPSHVSLVPGSLSMSPVQAQGLASFPQSQAQSFFAS